MKKSIKIILISILSIALIFSFSNVVKAAEGDYVEIEDYTTTPPAQTQTPETTTPETTTETNKNEETTKTPTTEENKKADKDIPKTGVVEDTIMIVLIATALVAAFYAYKKVKKYNF